MHLIKTIFMRYFFIFFIILTQLVLAQKKTNVKLYISNAPNNSFTLETFHQGNFTPQSKTLNNGHATLELLLKHLEFFKITFTKQHIIVVIAQPGDNITIRADFKNLFETIQIDGSLFTTQVYDIEKKNLFMQKQIDSIIQKYNSLPVNERNALTTQEYQKIIDSIQHERFDGVVDFIRRNIKSPATLFFIEKLDKNKYYTLYDSVANSLHTLYPETYVVVDFYRKVMAQKRIAMGTQMENIKLPSVSSDTLSLYPLNAKLVIIDFWASWCGHCRRENPLKIRLYQNYSDKGLRYFSISLDRDKQAWINAIQTDKLIWTDHVSELKGWNSEVARYYNITGIPANIIIDDNGRILALNLRGLELERFIDQYFSK